MKSEKLWKSITAIDESFLIEAQECKQKKKPRLRARWIAVAACLFAAAAAVALGMGAMQEPHSPDTSAVPTQSAPPQSAESSGSIHVQEPQSLVRLESFGEFLAFFDAPELSDGEFEAYLEENRKKTENPYTVYGIRSREDIRRFETLLETVGYYTVSAPDTVTVFEAEYLPDDPGGGTYLMRYVIGGVQYQFHYQYIGDDDSGGTENEIVETVTLGGKTVELYRSGNGRALLGEIRLDDYLVTVKITRDAESAPLEQHALEQFFLTKEVP